MRLLSVEVGERSEGSRTQSRFSRVHQAGARSEPGGPTDSGARCRIDPRMPRGRKPLLAELHEHTNWSDGVLAPGELGDLYGRAGFDVLAITDHVVRSEVGCHVRVETFRDYLADVDAEAERARTLYGMVVVPG